MHSVLSVLLLIPLSAAVAAQAPPEPTPTPPILETPAAVATPAPNAPGPADIELGVTAEKKGSSGKSLFKQICEPEGRADLVVDAPSRSFQLKNIKVRPKCKGIVGRVVNFIAPLVTKSYSEMTVFQMPPGRPFTVESVGSGANYVAIAGRVDWEAGKEAAPTPASASGP